ncbi:serine/threonine protein kinase [Actinacidiphila oryziradicis]|uniref:non-specific serine/threonine protein kinase n=2 Tax=Actinacidiphila oryziradicis TaxID=2571141 RepID=A0A4V5N0F5_9ACTN|nr:serine/threonine protein kinase [Actinacidiphila oryziradicis]
MGEVWRAVDEVLGRQVAVKVLRNQGVDDVTRFRLEAWTAARLNHPHVVAVYDFGADQDRLYLVMELLDGRSLADELAEYIRLSPERVAAIGAQVAAGLAAAHSEGVLHRDVKPANLLVASDDTVKIADFGIARFADESALDLTATGQVIGTSSYLAPERALGRVGGPAADMYALGCVLYELLTGRPPFQADTATAVVYQHVDAAPVPARRHRPDLPEQLDALVLSLLAKDPGERPTAQQTADALGSLLTTRGGGIPRQAGKAAQRPAATSDGGTRQFDAAALASEAKSGRPPGTGILHTRRSQVIAGVVAAGAVAAATLSALPPGTGRAAPAAPFTTQSTGSPTPTMTTASKPTPSTTPHQTTTRPAKKAAPPQTKKEKAKKEKAKKAAPP